MTNDGLHEIDQLREEVRCYHEAVMRHLVRCETCQRDLDGLRLTIYGRDGEDNAAGLRAHVRSLLEFRQNVRAGIGVLWAAILALAAPVFK